MTGGVSDVAVDLLIDDDEDGFHWLVVVGGLRDEGLEATRSDAQREANDAIERLRELHDRGRCLVCLRQPRRQGALTCSDRCADQRRRFLARRYARVPPPAP